MTLIEEFVKNGILDTNQAFSVGEDVDHSGKSLDEVLVNMNVDETTIISIKKEYFSDIPYHNYTDLHPVDDSILRYIPAESAERYRIIPLGISSDDELEVGMLNPGDLTAKTILQFISSKIGKPYKIYLIS